MFNVTSVDTEPTGWLLKSMAARATTPPIECPTTMTWGGVGVRVRVGDVAGTSEAEGAASSSSSSYNARTARRQLFTKPACAHKRSAENADDSSSKSTEKKSRPWRWVCAVARSLLVEPRSLPRGNRACPSCGSGCCGGCSVL